MEIFLIDQNIVFTVAICIALLLGTLELLSLMLGGITEWFDTIVPDTDIDGPEMSFLSYLCIGRVPFLIWLVIFLLSFGLTGIIVQLLLNSFFGFYLPALIAFIAILPISALPTRYIAIAVNKVLPKDETAAISQNEFAGHRATIVIGSSYRNHPAQARFKDIHGTTHYIMVEPNREDDVYTAGEEVIIVTKSDTSNVFYVRQ